MKKFLLIIVFLVILLVVYPFLNQSDDVQVLTGLPWQIEINADGSTQVFHIHLGHSQLADAIDVLGTDMQIAVIAGSDEIGSLEMYYGHYRAGLLSGKLILQTQSSEQDIKYWRDNAVKFETMASGQAVKYSLSEDDLTRALAEVIVGITFIPSINLDEETIFARFGRPDASVQSNGLTRYIYHDKGLDIALYAESKEVFQYVIPDYLDNSH